MNDEAPNSTSEGEASNDEPQEEKTARPARKSTKKVVSRVRDAKTKTGPRDVDSGADSDGRSAADQGRSGDSSDEAPQEIPMVVEEAPRDGRSNSGREERRRPARGRRPAKTATSSRSVEPVDPEELSKRAWKIYQADVAEEGITLIDNTTGRQLALRSFELARVFLEEQARQIKLNKPSNGSKREKSSGREERKDGDEDGDS